MVPPIAGIARWDDSLAFDSGRGSPWGQVVAEAGEDPGVIFADLDLAQSDAEARARILSLKHGRDFEVEVVGRPGQR